MTGCSVWCNANEAELNIGGLCYWWQLTHHSAGTTQERHKYPPQLQSAARSESGYFANMSSLCQAGRIQTSKLTAALWALVPFSVASKQQQRYTNPGIHFVRWRLVFVNPSVWTLLHVAFVAPTILKWLLDIWKMCASLKHNTSLVFSI